MFTRFAITSLGTRRLGYSLIAIAIVQGWAGFATAQSISNFGRGYAPSATVWDAGGSRPSPASCNEKHQRASALYNEHCAQCHGVDGRGILKPGPRVPLTWRESLAFARHLRNFSKQDASQSPPACPAKGHTREYFAPMQMPPMMLPPIMLPPMQQTGGPATPTPSFHFHPPSQIQFPPQTPALSPTRTKPSIEMVAPIPQPQAELPPPKRRPRPVPLDLTPEELEQELDRQLPSSPREFRRDESLQPSDGATRPTRFPILSSPRESVSTGSEDNTTPSAAPLEPQHDQRFAYPRTQTPDMKFTRWPQTDTPHSPFSQE